MKSLGEIKGFYAFVGTAKSEFYVRDSDGSRLDLNWLNHCEWNFPLMLWSKGACKSATQNLLCLLKPNESRDVLLTCTLSVTGFHQCLLRIFLPFVCCV